MTKFQISNFKHSSRPVLSIIIPVYNEEATIGEVIEVVKQLPVIKEIIVVNDGSTDGTADVLAGIYNILVIQHEKNRGKGAAVKSATPHIHGKYVIIQDGDLETDPRDIEHLLQIIKSRDCDVVFGSRWWDKNDSPSLITLENKLITWWGNLFLKQKVTDLACSYKLIPTRIFLELEIETDGFGLEAEITMKLDHRDYRIKETPITYNRRGKKEGKKLRIIDGVMAAWSCLKFVLGKK